jgi:hypothetical protein
MSGVLHSYLEVINAAKANSYFEDFKTEGRLDGDVRTGYQARMSAFLELSEQGFVRLESGHLVLGTLSPASWLTNSLSNGEAESWEICDSYPEKLRKFKPDVFNLEQIGREGEDFVVSWLKSNLESDLHPEIIHTSLFDDGAGYDISSPCPRLQGQILLEVKTTSRSGDDFIFHLSRNEWNTAIKNFNWYLVLVRKTKGSFDLFGYLDSKSLVNYYPDDKHKDFCWSSVVGKFGPDDVFSGLPGF